MKETKLYKVNISDFGITDDICEKLSNVVVIGLDTDRIMTFIDHLDPEALDEGEQSSIKDVCNEIIDSLTLLKKEKTCTPDDTEHRFPYHSTVDGMLSPDYKERFKAEYQQTKIRYEKLKAFCNKIEAAQRTQSDPFAPKKAEEPKHDCPVELLREQQGAMGQYLHILEVRAIIEGIEL